MALAPARGSGIVALSVARPTYLMPADESDLSFDPACGLEGLMHAADRNVQAVARIAAEAGVACSTLTILSDTPSDEIVAAAEREQCDLIVMGSHGRRGLRLLLSGSETQNVLDATEVPVLVLRPDLPILG